VSPFSQDFGIEKSSAVVYGQDLDSILASAVDDSVAADENLANVLESQLWNDPAGTGGRAGL
jgi:hypothetical protein